jgi:modification methylase
LSSSNVGALVLDPFFGSGTTGAVAKRLHRHWLGIERDENYVRIAQQRIDEIIPHLADEQSFDVRVPRRRQPKLPFGYLLESGLLVPGQTLYFRKDREKPAILKPDGKLRIGEFEGSIHAAGKHYMNGGPCNGWDHWYFEAADGELQVIDNLRVKLLREMGLLKPEA